MSERLRLAELLGGLSIAADLGYGLPVDTALRSCLIGTQLARLIELPEPEVREAFYVSLLFHVGCVAYSHETSELFGDDLAMNHAVVESDLTDLRDILTTLVPHSTRGLPVRSRLKGAVRIATTGRAFGKAHNQASCEVARSVSRRVGLPEGVSDGLHDIHEWWNGNGARSLRGEEIARSARIARVASEASEYISLHPRHTVAGALRRRAGKTLDPRIVERFCVAASTIIEEVTTGDPRARLLDIEPSPVLEISDEDDLRRIARAFGDMADLKNPFTHGHSQEVTRLAVAAAERLHLDRRTTHCLEVGASLHDLGRIGVSNRVWAKPGPLTTSEREQVHLHAYYSERILASTEGLKPMAPMAGMHHERLDGSGYHRGCRAQEIDIAARVLACADAFQAMTQPRPQRPALHPEHARDELLAEARAGRLDPDVVTAVVDAANQTPPSRSQHVRPGGLSDREVEVLALVAQGRSNPEIGRSLGISRRTAEHHVQHIYTKIGVSTRAAAALFALEHGLLPGR
jgi:HD-GYP domain-containing protein (c-di-GMP phosphodiesterase class II)